MEVTLTCTNRYLCHLGGLELARHALARNVIIRASTIGGSNSRTCIWLLLLSKGGDDEKHD